MMTLHEIGDQTFSWRPVKGTKKTIEVYSSEAVFGTLRMERGQPAVAEVGGERWVFDRSNGSMVVRRGEDGTTAATFEAAKGGEGLLTLDGGEQLRWAPTHKGQAERAFYDENGRRVVRF
jgi:hypothetical protein